MTVYATPADAGALHTPSMVVVVVVVVVDVVVVVCSQPSLADGSCHQLLYSSSSVVSNLFVEKWHEAQQLQ